MRPSRIITTSPQAKLSSISTRLLFFNTFVLQILLRFVSSQEMSLEPFEFTLKKTFKKKSATR